MKQLCNIINLVAELLCSSHSLQYISGVQLQILAHSIWVGLKDSKTPLILICVGASAVANTVNIWLHFTQLFMIILIKLAEKSCVFFFSSSLNYTFCYNSLFSAFYNWTGKNALGWNYRQGLSCEKTFHSKSQRTQIAVSYSNTAINHNEA